MTAVFERCAKCGGVLGAFRVQVAGEAFHPRCSHDARDHRIADLEAALKLIAAGAVDYHTSAVQPRADSMQIAHNALWPSN